MATILEIECTICKSKFSVKKGNEKLTCSSECRSKLREIKDEKHYVVKKCLGCGNEFKSKKKENKKTCSYKCMGLLRKIKSIENRECVQCGKDFQVRKLLENKTCSQECREKWNLNPKNIEKRINASKKAVNNKYGVDSVLSIKEIHNKGILTRSNFDDKKILEINNKTKRTKKDKYNNENYNNYFEIYNTKLKKYKDGTYNNRELFSETINNKLYIRLLDLGYTLENINNNLLTIKHPDGHVFETTRSLAVIRLNENREISTKYLPYNPNISNYELEINNYILSLEFKTIMSDKILIKPYEIDILIPSNNIGIEVNGLYWHSEIYKKNNYHINKTNLCENNNFKLIHLFEDEWVHKKDIVKSIIKNKLGITPKKIYGRKCNIIDLSSSEYKNFLNINHLMGSTNSKFKIGLTYNNEIVSVMGFEKQRKSLGDNVNGYFNLNRFSNKIDTTVIGGASKLLKYFIKKYDASNIISYADKRYSDGNLYEKLGFNFIHNTKPNYWYIDYRNISRIHRFNFRKKILEKDGFDINKSEHQIMLERGIFRIYDCGNIKFELKIKKP